MTDNESRAMGTCGHRAAVRLSGLCISCMARELDLAEQRGAERTASGYAALVDAARTLCEHYESDEGCSVEDFKNVEAALARLP